MKDACWHYSLQYVIHMSSCTRIYIVTVLQGICGMRYRGILSLLMTVAFCSRCASFLPKPKLLDNVCCDLFLQLMVCLYTGVCE